MPAKKDFTQVAYAVVQQATGATLKQAPAPKQEGQRKGGLKGGKGRMDALSADERRALALKAAAARWNKGAPGPDGTGAGKASKRG